MLLVRPRPESVHVLLLRRHQFIVTRDTHALHDSSLPPLSCAMLSHLQRRPVSGPRHVWNLSLADWRRGHDAPPVLRQTAAKFELLLLASTFVQSNTYLPTGHGGMGRGASEIDWPLTRRPSRTMTPWKILPAVAAAALALGLV